MSLATGSGLRGPCFLSLEANGMVSPNPKSTNGLCVPKNFSNISWGAAASSGKQECGLYG